jgi:hypothetical protein
MIKPVNYLHPIRYVDTSRSRSSEILREAQFIRIDQEYQHQELVRTIKETTAGKTSRSPYWPDRPASSPERIQGSAKETAWKNAGPPEREALVVDHKLNNLKKLNIV